MKKQTIKNTNWKYTLSRGFKEEDTMSLVVEQWRRNKLCASPRRTRDREAKHDTTTGW